MRRARGFTLTELLITIGIIGVLIAILLPTISKARVKANDTLCAARLRDLLAASTIYFNQNNSYPPPRILANLGGPMPMAISQEVVNQLGTVMHWPVVDYTMNVDQLPINLVCPLRADVELLQAAEPPATFGESFWNTGYSYCGGLTEINATTATALLPDRIAFLRGRQRGVLWSDNLYSLCVGGALQGFSFWHFNRNPGTNPASMMATDASALRGINRGWTDGSVDWIPGSTLNLQMNQADSSAAYRVGPVGQAVVYFYY